MKIPKALLATLRAAGLLVSEYFVPNHVMFPDGVIVCKPASVRGNCIPGYQASWGLDGTTVDAPDLKLHYNGAKWVVTSLDYVPGPGPGDFVTEWDTPEQAVADILSFFFVDSSRMEVKRKPATGLRLRGFLSHNRLAFV